MTASLQASVMIDSDHPAVIEFARRASNGISEPRALAASLYLAVRDGFRYDPYATDVSVDGLRASSVLRKGHGWCVTKSALLAAACRAMGIPARVGYADVRNHLSTPRMRATMGTDTFYWHGYTSILIDDRWIKATPAFNIELCEKFKLRPLEFDGTADSIYHPYDLEGRRHKEYIADRGEFDDIPLDEILATFAVAYPKLDGLRSADFRKDVG